MIDLHCHLDLYPDPEKVARQCEHKDVSVLSVTTTPSAWRGTQALERPGIRTALGLHPQLARERRSELSLFDRLLPETHYVGEIGLDGSGVCRSFWNDQLAVFEHVLSASAAVGGRILSIHSRRAAASVLDCLDAHPEAGIPVLHWFSGSNRELARAVAAGCWFSVGPAMLKGEKGRTLTARMPRDRVITESDGPFAQIGNRAAMPWDVISAQEELARLWGLENIDVATILKNNFRALAIEAN